MLFSFNDDYYEILAYFYNYKIQLFAIFEGIKQNLSKLTQS